MKQLDLHVHAKLSKVFPLEPDKLLQTVAQAQRVGLDGMALVEHFHAPDFWELWRQVGSMFAYRDGTFCAPGGFRMLTGAELTLREQADLVLLGSLDRLRAFDGALRWPATSGYKPSFEEAVAVARQAGLFAIGAHLFRPDKPLHRLGIERLRLLDAVEMNGRDFFDDVRVAPLARQMERPAVGGSDAHYWPQVGIKATVLPISEITQESVTSAIASGQVSVRSAPHGPIAVQVASTYKKIARAQRSRRSLRRDSHGSRAAGYTPLSEVLQRSGAGDRALAACGGRGG